jgi:hypothetical protein
LIAVALCTACAVPASSPGGGADLAGASAPLESGGTSAPVNLPDGADASTATAPVTRRSPAPPVKAKPLARGTLSRLATVSYPDGVVVRVDDFNNGVEDGRGPGVFSGRAFTAVTLTVSNGSTAPVDLNEVVVTATYGSPAVVASPVYENPQAQDFSGIAPPGGALSALYVFAIPPKDRGSATLQVDVDAAHDPAVFGGGLR